MKILKTKLYWSCSLISLLFKAVPAFFALNYLQALVFDIAFPFNVRPFMFGSRLYQLTGIPAIETMTLTALLFAKLFSALYISRREQRVALT